MFRGNCSDTIQRDRALPLALAEREGAFFQRVRTETRRVLAVLSEWRRRHRTRKQLSQMNDYQLRDIGVSRDEASREANLPFWCVGGVRETPEKSSRAQEIAREYPFD